MSEGLWIDERIVLDTIKNNSEFLSILDISEKTPFSYNHVNTIVKKLVNLKLILRIDSYKTLKLEKKKKGRLKTVYELNGK